MSLKEFLFQVVKLQFKRHPYFALFMGVSRQTLYALIRDERSEFGEVAQI